MRSFIVLPRTTYRADLSRERYVAKAVSTLLPIEDLVTRIEFPERIKQAKCFNKLPGNRQPGQPFLLSSEKVKPPTWRIQAFYFVRFPPLLYYITIYSRFDLKLKSVIFIRVHKM